MITAAFMITYLDFEHSVANTVLFMIAGLQGGIPVGATLGKPGIVLSGNMVGGGVLIGFYYAWVNDGRDRHKRITTRRQSAAPVRTTGTPP